MWYKCVNYPQEAGSNNGRWAYQKIENGNQAYCEVLPDSSYLTSTVSMSKVDIHDLNVKLCHRSCQRGVRLPPNIRLKASRIRGRGFKDHDLRFRLQGFDFRVQGSGPRVHGLRASGSREYGPSKASGVKVSVSERRTAGVEFGIFTSGFRV